MTVAAIARACAQGTSQLGSKVATNLTSTKFVQRRLFSFDAHSSHSPLVGRVSLAKTSGVIAAFLATSVVQTHFHCKEHPEERICDSIRHKLKG